MKIYFKKLIFKQTVAYIVAYMLQQMCSYKFSIAKNK